MNSGNLVIEYNMHYYTPITVKILLLFIIDIKRILYIKNRIKELFGAT